MIDINILLKISQKQGNKLKHVDTHITTNDELTLAGVYAENGCTTVYEESDIVVLCGVGVVMTVTSEGRWGYGLMM